MTRAQLLKIWKVYNSVMLTDKYFAYLQLERFWEPTSWMNRPVTVVRSQPRERPPPAPGPTSGPLRPLKIKKVSFVSFLWANGIKFYQFSTKFCVGQGFWSIKVCFFYFYWLIEFGYFRGMPPSFWKKLAWDPWISSICLTARESAARSDSKSNASNLSSSPKVHGI